MKPKYCVAVADARRARIFELTEPALEAFGESRKLVEVADLIQPQRRLRAGEVFANSRPGLRRVQAGGAPGHAVDDRRDAHRAEDDRRFADQVVAAIDRVAAHLDANRIVVAASHKMLGWMRPQLDRLGNSGAEIVELALDLTPLTPARLYAHLASENLLP